MIPSQNSDSSTQPRPPPSPWFDALSAGRCQRCATFESPRRSPAAISPVALNGITTKPKPFNAESEIIVIAATNATTDAALAEEVCRRLRRVS